MIWKNLPEITYIFTNDHQQLALVSISDNIEREIHPDNDQFIRVEQGIAEITINDKDRYILKDGDSIIIPAGTYHEVTNIQNTPVKLYIIHSPRIII